MASVSIHLGSTASRNHALRIDNIWMDHHTTLSKEGLAGFMADIANAASADLLSASEQVSHVAVPKVPCRKCMSASRLTSLKPACPYPCCFCVHLTEDMLAVSLNVQQGAGVHLAA